MGVAIILIITAVLIGMAGNGMSNMIIALILLPIGFYFAVRIWIWVMTRGWNETIEKRKEKKAQQDSEVVRKRNKDITIICCVLVLVAIVSIVAIVKRKEYYASPEYAYEVVSEYVETHPVDMVYHDLPEGRCTREELYSEILKLTMWVSDKYVEVRDTYDPWRFDMGKVTNRSVARDCMGEYRDSYHDELLVVYADNFKQLADSSRINWDESRDLAWKKNGIHGVINALVYYKCLENWNGVYGNYDLTYYWGLVECYGEDTLFMDAVEYQYPDYIRQARQNYREVVKKEK